MRIFRIITRLHQSNHSKKMRSELRDVIARFRRDQELALDYLHNRLSIPVPKNNYEWAANGHELLDGVASIVDRDGVTLFKHGIGIEVSHPDFQVDFDYGPDGECDCFDSWRLRLHEHIRQGYEDPVSCLDNMHNWLAEAAADGYLALVSKTFSVYRWPESVSKWNRNARTL